MQTQHTASGSHARAAQRPQRPLRAAACVVAWSLGLVCAPTLADPLNLPGSTVTWLGGSGDWNDSNNWLAHDISGFPQRHVPGSFDDVHIDGKGYIISQVNLSGNQTVGTLSIDGGDRLLILDGSGLVTQFGTLSNDGSVAVKSAGTLTQVTTNALTGTGTLRLNGPSARLNMYTQGTGHTLRGGGLWTTRIPAGRMFNLGTVVADDPLQALTILPESSLGFVNRGLMRAEGGGTLALQGNGEFTNESIFDIAQNSILEVGSGGTATRLVGGTLINAGAIRMFRDATIGNATIRHAGVGILTGGRLANVRLTGGGETRIENGSGIRVIRGLVNDTTITLQDGRSRSTLEFFSGNSTLSGGGSVVLTGSNSTIAIGHFSAFKQEAGHTIRGGGLIRNFGGQMINEGNIVADHSTTALRLDGGGFVNRGTLRAIGAGGLDLTFGNFDNTDHAIDVARTSRLRLLGATLAGGTIQNAGTTFLRDATLDRITVAGGTVFIEGNNSLKYSTLDGIALTGSSANAQIDGTLVVRNSLVNNSTLRLVRPPVRRTLLFSGTQSLGGAGEIQMDGALASIESQGVLTQAAGHTIRGNGQLLANTGGMINQGNIVADHASEALVIDPNNLGFVNQGVITAAGRAGIDLIAGATDFTSSGAVEILAGSRIDTTGVYRQTGGTTTVNGLLTATTRVDIMGGRLQGAGTVRGTVNNLTGGTVGPGNSPGILTIDGDYTQDAASTLEIEIAGLVAGMGFDLLDITGLANLDGILDVIVDRIFAQTLAVGDTFTFLRAGGGVLGQFASLSVNLAEIAFEQIINATGVTLRVTRNGFAAVPTPGVLALLGLGMLGLFRGRGRSNLYR